MVKAMEAAKTVTLAQDSEWLDMCVGSELLGKRSLLLQNANENLKERLLIK